MPDSGIPRKKRAAIRPAAFLDAAMHATITPPVGISVAIIEREFSISYK
jgi:hypothetical protein